MSGVAVQQFLARCLVDPHFFDKARADLDSALGCFGLTEDERQDFRRFDLDRVRSFAGLVTKVQNNGLWQTFPSTRLLMDRYALDLELFAAYRVQHQHDRADAASHVTRTRHFAAFFRDWLAEQGPDRYPGLLDVFQHERLWLEHRLALKSEEPMPARTPAGFLAHDDQFLDGLVPAVRGLLFTEFFQYNPAEVVQALNADPAAIEELEPYPRYLAYWGDRACLKMRIFEVDATLLDLLERVDGTSVLGSLFPRADPQRRGVRQAVREMAAVGVLTLREEG